ncbi:tellurite resistance TerB family protein [Amphiplicatus metriothermophilus]|uniref:Uncharacterized conserved protein, tellurite resistance protein B (TerB) family n=1 Tax=Amphiplicatus metriothermophilus TaxID=1519374 RepID=A0A239PQ20_9PROT|nr:TerB family tellurite resistance protein [Amphiplicatus metriothermophilus]MBB5518604.1 putative tellurite resistance protein B-like protein [Amphiplicatus metriothermophilus]SNT72238.1 Uncharacterized conserved protein, tellurite resistance protein B (TerB) family [Amphiplicatus metriothermophilus]
MFSKLKSFFAPARPRANEPDSRLSALQHAVAALLVEAARADARYEAAEKALIDEALARQFGLSPAEAAALRAEAEAAQSEALDIHRYTKIAKTMSAADRIRLVEHLWRIILSDRERDPYEDALMRRLCGLIYVSDQESGAARRRVEAALSQG